jgi:wobble nucleotide-excising tRNase
LAQLTGRLTNTKWLSDKKSELAKVVVSPAFIDRFQQQLKALRASHIKVAVERTRTDKAQVFHQIKLVGVKVPTRTAEVLSEGEFRIVSLAAFLADVESRSSSSTFIFDDPVSSLDQEFEKATANRLVALAKGRQVIVFTHRLSMLAPLESAAEEAGIEPSVIR